MDLSGETITAIWRISLLSMSAIAWVYSRKILKSQSSPPALSIRGIDYMIFLWIFMAMLLMLNISLQYLSSFFLEATEPLSRDWQAVQGGLTLQIPLLCAVILALKAPKLAFSHARLNSEPSKTARELWVGVQFFFICLPGLWVINILWKLILEFSYQRFSDSEPEAQELVQTLVSSTEITPIILLVFIGAILAPIAEEFFFRGSVYRFAKQKMGISKAMMLSALIFALVHYNMSAVLPLFAVGLCLAGIYELRGNIWAPIAFHAAFNAQSLFVIFVLK